MSLAHENTDQRRKSVQEVSKRTGTASPFAAFDKPDKRQPKTTAAYWYGSIYFPTYYRDGQKFEVEEYACKIGHAGHREEFQLGTSNKTVAANKARDIYLSLQSIGWEATRAKYKPKANKIATTVGEFLAEIEAKASNQPKTIAGYSKAFRTIVAAVMGIDGGNDKYDYRTGGHQKWMDRVHAVKLAAIEPAKVQKWKIDCLKKAGSDPAKQRVAKISINSTLRQAKSLFSKKMLKFIVLDLPGALPFAGVEFEPRQSMRYRSDFDVSKIIRLAMEGDASEGVEPLPEEQRKIFLLAVMAGLRRGEIDVLEWSAFRWDAGLIRLQNTRHLHLKSEDSAGDVPLDQEVLNLFRDFHAKAKSGFVIESEVSPRPGALYNHYRCQRHFAAVTKWLRENGVKGNRPLHTLRKEFGSQLCAKYGIYAASFALRHADIGITSQHYLDNRKRVTVGLGALLAKSETPLHASTEESEAAPAKTPSRKKARPASK